MKPFELYTLTNPKDIIDVISKDDLYKNILELDTLEGWYPDLMTTNWFAAERAGDIVGVLILHHLTSNTCTFHGGVYKKFRGETVNYARKLLDSYVPYGVKLITTISSTNKQAQYVVEQLGFVVTTRVKDGYKSGDLLIYSKPEKE